MSFLPVRQRHHALRRIHAVHRQLHAPRVFSHESAALLWELGLWNVPPRVHVIQQYRAGSRACQRVVRHYTDPGDVMVLGGVPVTSLARTTADCLMTMHPMAGLVVADAAMARGLSPPGALRALHRRGRCRGRTKAEILIDAAEPGQRHPDEYHERFATLQAAYPETFARYPAEP
ncbi:MAG: hypothetical protein LBH13_03860 [Cellulomonadaceae bacterium]|jgi:hypothetical protein|nr:hypothetical protein [Cellulomonadaceae bacterium]